jgi:hypothetical protein
MHPPGHLFRRQRLENQDKTPNDVTDGTSAPSTKDNSDVLRPPCRDPKEVRIVCYDYWLLGTRKYDMRQVALAE